MRKFIIRLLYDENGATAIEYGLIAALIYGGMIALVAYVQVQPREMTQTVPIPKPAK